MNESSWCLALEVRVADEPAASLGPLWTLLRSLLASLGDEPAELFTTSPDGRTGRTHKFSWKTIEALGIDPRTGTITVMGLRSHTAAFDLSLYLRHNPKLDVRDQPPASLTMAVEMNPESFAPEGLAEAAVEFVAGCARHMSVLHGGVTRLDNLAQALSETSGIGVDRAKQPERFQRRFEHDCWMNQKVIRTRCRRLYWATLLGPDLAGALGGAEAARAAGALDVHELDGALVFRAMEGPPRDSLDPEFLAATTRLRRWLWPHTFQNPLDAAGFEDEVGLTAP